MAVKRSGFADLPYMLDLLPQFSVAPTLCQFAKDGVWEKAWSFRCENPLSPSDLKTYLSGRTEIAFEAFFGRSFFGIRFFGAPLEVERFCIKCLNATKAGQSFFDALRQELGLPTRNHSLAFAELGCVNAWRAFGSVRLSNLEQAVADFETVWRAVSDSPVGRNRSHAKAIEFAFGQPLQHWFGLPVSEPERSKRVSKVLLRLALECGATVAKKSC